MENFKKYLTSENDVRFPSFLQGFNRRWYAENCQVVYVCFNPTGVSQALDDAILNYKIGVKIKSGGHCYEDFVCGKDTNAIIDVTYLDQYGKDDSKGYYLESGGNNWEAFKALFRDFGKVLPSGSCYSVGLGGHISGGGYGLLSRLNGLTVDWLTGVEVVVKDDSTKEAKVIYVSKESLNSELDLFWSHCGGGGGNFGVITKYYFKELPDSPKSAFITTLSFQWSDLTVEILSNLMDWYYDFSKRDDNWRQFGLFALNHKANGSINLTIQTVVMKGEDGSQIYEDFVSPIFKQIDGISTNKISKHTALSYRGNLFQNSNSTTEFSFYEAVQALDAVGTNRRGKYKSAYQKKKFPIQHISAIFEHLQKVPEGLELEDMSQCLLQVDTYGGKVNTIKSDETAIAQRSSFLKLQYQAYWSAEQKDASYIDWINYFYTEVYQASGGVPDPAFDDSVDGCYYNYPDIELNKYGGVEGAMYLYFLQNFNRLQLTKTRWDPNNYFNSSQSIPVLNKLIDKN